MRRGDPDSSSKESFSPAPLGCTEKSMPPPCHSHHPSWQPYLISLPSFICQNQILIGLRCDGANVNAAWHVIKWSWIQPPVQHAAGGAQQGEPSRGVSGALAMASPKGCISWGFVSNLFHILFSTDALASVNAHTQAAHKHTH